MAFWNPWHGCRKISDGCANCYVYRIDGRHGRDASQVARTASFDLPLRRDRRGGYKIPAGEMVYTCFSSDFFLAEADEWRPEAWQIMRQRSDLDFFLTTKRIDRLASCLPPEWGEQGWPNVTIACTVENQDRADFRMPIYTAAPLSRRVLLCEPLLGAIDLREWLRGGGIEEVIAGGESGPEARPCRYEWILSLREQCSEAGVRFHFKQTGARFVKEGRLYRIPRALQHVQARRAAIYLS